MFVDHPPLAILDIVQGTFSSIDRGPRKPPNLPVYGYLEKFSSHCVNFIALDQIEYHSIHLSCIHEKITFEESNVVRNVTRILCQEIRPTLTLKGSEWPQMRTDEEQTGSHRNG